MDNREFTKHLDELVTIKYGTIGRNGQCDAINANPKISVRHEAQPCGDCDRMVQGRKINYYIVHYGRNSPCWVKQCLNCKHKERLEKLVF